MSLVLMRMTEFQHSVGIFVKQDPSIHLVQVDILALYIFSFLLIFRILNALHALVQFFNAILS